MKKATVGVALLSVASALACAGSAAASPGKFASIAYSEKTGAVGASWNFDTQGDVEADAVGRCVGAGGQSCHVACTVQGGCVALASGDPVNGNHPAGWSRDPNQGLANDLALGECAKRTQHCVIRESVCSL
jgi:Domain of unknown function (DUF4189)